MMDARESLIRIVLVALLLYAAACLASARGELRKAGEEEALLRARLEAAEHNTLELSRRLEEGWSEQELEALARERLGLVRPGERIYTFASDARSETGE